MKPLFLLLMILSLSTVLEITVPPASQSASGHCSVHNRIQLHQVGYTQAEVADLCSRASADIPFSSPWGILAGEGHSPWVQWCVTPQGSCSLNPATSGYYPIGAPCNCYMPWGSYGGVAQ